MMMSAGSSDGQSRDRVSGLSAIELLSIVGFGCYLAWMLSCFYWLTITVPQPVGSGIHELIQLFIFVGLFAGFLLMTFIVRRPQFNIFSIPVLVVEAIFLMILPLISFVFFNGLAVPLPLVAVANFLAGIAGAAMRTSWLDIASRIRTSHYRRYTGVSFIVGFVLFAISVITIETIQPIFSFGYGLISLGLLLFCTERADLNDERAALESIDTPWTFVKEIEPSIFMDNVVFGVAFVALYNAGPAPMFIGLSAALAGAITAALLSLLNKEISITVYLRFWLVCLLVVCVVAPFVSPVWQLVCACVVTFNWALFRCVNSSFIIRKAVMVRDVPLFRQAPLRLLVSASGFALGWLIATVVTLIFGPDPKILTFVYLALAVAMVAMMMFFFPVSAHHAYDGKADEAAAPATNPVVTETLDESEAFTLRCRAVALLYQLSPRETDILMFLARGRNAAYIQEELTISPHTVKSHIYNIYRKLDIHSQQTLMSLVEDYELDERDLRKLAADEKHPS